MSGPTESGTQPVDAALVSVSVSARRPNPRRWRRFGGSISDLLRFVFKRRGKGDVRDFVDLTVDAGKSRLGVEVLKLEKLSVDIEAERASIRRTDAETQLLLAQAELARASAGKVTAETAETIDRLEATLADRGFAMLEGLRDQGVRIQIVDSASGSTVGAFVTRGQSTTHAVQAHDSETEPPRMLRAVSDRHDERDDG